MRKGIADREERQPPVRDLAVVSALSIGSGMRYCVVAKTPPAPNAAPVEPNLEDGYVALTRATGGP